MAQPQKGKLGYQQLERTRIHSSGKHSQIAGEIIKKKHLSQRLEGCVAKALQIESFRGQNL